MGQEIHKSGERLERLIENFLIYAQIELVAADPKNVNALRIGRTDHPEALIERHAVEQATQAGRRPDLAMELADVPVPIAEEYLSKIADELAAKRLQVFHCQNPGAR